MLTKNFPGRKNARRLKALQRLEKSKTAKSDEDQKRITKEIGILKSRIISDSEARSIQTKKYREKK